MIQKTCDICGKLFIANGPRALRCSAECRNAAKQLNRKNAIRKHKPAKSNLEDKERTARAQSKTYGMLVAEEQAKLVKIVFPVKKLPREIRAQQFHEMVEQYLLMEG